MLRAEKGYIIVGQETDGTVTPADVGLDWAIGKAKTDFVGKRSLTLPRHARREPQAARRPADRGPDVVLEEGAQVTENAAPPIGSHALGHVTSSYRSATLGRSIALALVAGGRGRAWATKLFVSTAGGAVAATVAAPLLLRPGREAPPCDGSDRRLGCTPRSPLDALTLPSGAALRARRRRRPPRASSSAAAKRRAPPARPLSASRCPERSARRSVAGERAALWLGPDEWLLIADGEAPEAARRGDRGRGRRPRRTASSTCPQRQVALVGLGRRRRPRAQRRLPARSAAEGLSVGMATRTLFDKAEIVLWRRGETEFRVEVWRSFSPWLAAALAEAARGAPAAG